MVEKFNSPCLPPAPQDREVIVTMIEEASEIAKECQEFIQRATKMLRFGIQEVQPGQDKTNAWRLGHEFGELQYMIDVAHRAGIIPMGAAKAGFESKRQKWPQFQQTQRMPDATNIPVRQETVWVESKSGVGSYEIGNAHNKVAELPRALVAGDRVRLIQALPVGPGDATLVVGTSGTIHGRAYSEARASFVSVYFPSFGVVAVLWSQLERIDDRAPINPMPVPNDED